MGITATHQAVMALNIYADTIEKLDKSLMDDLNELKAAFQTTREEIGPHASEIGSIVKCVEAALEVGKEPMNKMPQTLRTKAEQIHIFLNTGKQ